MSECREGQCSASSEDDASVVVKWIPSSKETNQTVDSHKEDARENEDVVIVYQDYFDIKRTGESDAGSPETSTVERVPFAEKSVDKPNSPPNGVGMPVIAFTESGRVHKTCCARYEQIQVSSCRTILTPVRHCRRLLRASSSGVRVAVGQGEGTKWGGTAKMERTILRDYGKPVYRAPPDASFLVWVVQKRPSGSLWSVVARHGLPPWLRVEVWMTWSGASTLRDMTGPSYYADLCRRTTALHDPSNAKAGLDQIDSDLARVFPPPLPLPLTQDRCHCCRVDSCPQAQEGEEGGVGEEESCRRAASLEEGEQSDDAPTEGSEEDPLSADDVDFRVLSANDVDFRVADDVDFRVLEERDMEFGKQGLLQRGEGGRGGEEEAGRVGGESGGAVKGEEEWGVAEVLSRMLHALDGQARGHRHGHAARRGQGPSCYVQGMHSVAKFLLDVSGGEEEDAFFLLTALVAHVLPHYYAYTAIREGRASSMHAVRQDTRVLEVLLEEDFPSLWHHMHRHLGITQLELFTPRLLLCVFCPDVLCLPTACRLWDLLLLTPPADRRAFLITVAYSIFRAQQSCILQANSIADVVGLVNGYMRRLEPDHATARLTALPLSRLYARIRELHTKLPYSYSTCSSARTSFCASCPAPQPPSPAGRAVGEGHKPGDPHASAAGDLPALRRRERKGSRCGESRHLF